MRITERQLRQIIREELNETRFAPMGSLKLSRWYPPRRAAKSVMITSLVYDTVYNDPGTRTQQWEAAGEAEVDGRAVQFTTGGGSFLTQPQSIIEGIANAISDASGRHVAPKAIDPGLNGHMDDLLASLEADEEYYQSAPGSEW